MNIDDNNDPVIDFNNDIDCSSYNVSSFKSKFQFINDKFLVVHQNIRSFNKNI